MDEGYIKLFRSMKSWQWYHDSNTKVVFLHLLLSANWEDSYYGEYFIPKGSLVTGYPKLSSQLGISIRNVRTAIKHLKKTGEVTVKVTNKFSIITIENWDKFQVYERSSDSQSDNQSGSQVTVNRQSSDNIKEYKEIKNIRREEDIRSDASVPDMEHVQEIFNKTCLFFKPCTVITKTRSEKIKKLLKQFSFEDIKEVFEKANKTDFLQGKNDRGWSASFDWLIEIDNFVKVKEDYFGSSRPIKEQVPEVSKAQNGRNPDFLRLLESESKGKHAGNDS